MSTDYVAKAVYGVTFLVGDALGETPDFYDLFRTLPKGFVFDECWQDRRDGWRDTAEGTLYVVGWGGTARRGEYMRITVPEPDAVAATLRRTLEPLGFWRPETLGFHLTNFGH